MFFFVQHFEAVFFQHFLHFCWGVQVHVGLVREEIRVSEQEADPVFEVGGVVCCEQQQSAFF